MVMATEIERKFLIDKLPDNLGNGVHIQQGYLMVCEDGKEIRIRKYGDKYFQTIKSAGNHMREETEIDITEHQFQQLWPLTEGKRIEKTRFIKKYNGHRYEIDRFNGKYKHLMIAEIEFKNEKQSNDYSPPEWLGKEITEENKYKNKNLAS